MRGLPLLTSLVCIATTFAFVASAAFVGSDQLAVSVCLSPFLLLREGAAAIPYPPRHISFTHTHPHTPCPFPACHRPPSRCIFIGPYRWDDGP